MVSEPISTLSTAKVTSMIPSSVPFSDETFHVPSLIATSTPITIAPCPNVSVGVLQPQILIAQTTPLYTESTSTTTTTTSSPQVTVNITDIGEGVFGVIVGQGSTRVLTLRDDDPDIILGDDRDDFKISTTTHSLFIRRVMMMMHQ